MEAKDLEGHLISIVIGLRFRQHFSIQDKLGEIIDSILYSKNSYFTPQMFPLVLDEAIGQKKLVSGEDAKNSITLGITDFILDMRINTENIKSHVGDIISNFKRQILEGVVKTYKLDQFNRIGYVRRYLIPDKLIVENFVKQTIGDTIGNPNEVTIRFSKKIPVEKAIFHEKYDDYENVIYNAANKVGDNRLILTVDYQHIFDPPAEDVDDIEFDDFIGRVHDYNATKLITWINNYGK
jgi:hypothetical protein